jgi:spermidine synthase
MKHYLVTGLIYTLFFLSGAAALVYQVAWVRSLSLIFGGSHLAVTVVLSVFMAGLAIGGYGIGKYADRMRKPLQFYGLLELGIGFSALLFMGLVKIYPIIYVSLAQANNDSRLYLTIIRILFSVIALIIPTSLMGGTLPVLSKFMSCQPRNLKNHLSFLYGFNTLGAALGAAAAGFFFLRLYSVSATLYGAILTNVIIGLAGIALQSKAVALLNLDASNQRKSSLPPETNASTVSLREDVEGKYPFNLVAWGIGVSGFCALGYEVLWTRILSLVVGVSVYSFTTMLVAFLTGIGLGSGAYALWAKLFNPRVKSVRRSITGFGIVQIIIGVTALLVTIYLRELPTNILRLHNYFLGMGVGLFGTRLWSNFVLAYAYMLIPAFFMGLAFPLAGKIHAEHKNVVGRAVGEVLAYNTVGAIIGTAASGLAMIYLFGIERSLQMLTVINMGYGLFILVSLSAARPARWVVPAATAMLLLFLALNQTSWRIWDTKFFAVFRSNQMGAFDTPEKVRDALDNTDVLYYAEGAESIVSVVKPKGGELSFITNGRVEASAHLQGQQVMFALSHLPMLLHQNPKRALVIALGSGMTLGAISVHPGLEELTLVEIEPKVVGVARTFAAYNHKVLDNPKLSIVFNDGRNFLLTTPNKYDVITADPIHPWFRGAGYLYTSEYFQLVSERLLPGGIAAQWLPLYELTPADLQSIVKTFCRHFRHTMLWLTHYDAELIGSNEPIVIDEAHLARRISAPAISADLKRVMMGSADDLLSYFLMGTQGMQAFAGEGIVNTDDNLYLEFSAPLSIGNSRVMEADIMALYNHRESILPYLVRPESKIAQAVQEKKWTANREAQRISGLALALLLGGRSATPEFRALMDQLENNYSSYAPGRFLINEYQSEAASTPRLLQKEVFNFLAEGGKTVVKEISAVLAPVNKERAAVMFVDNDARIVYGQLYVSGPGKEAFIDRFVQDTMMAIRTAYQEEAFSALRGKRRFPEADATLRKIKEIIQFKVQEKK